MKAWKSSKEPTKDFINSKTKTKVLSAASFRRQNMHDTKILRCCSENFDVIYILHQNEVHQYTHWFEITFDLPVYWKMEKSY